MKKISNSNSIIDKGTSSAFSKASLNFNNDPRFQLQFGNHLTESSSNTGFSRNLDFSNNDLVAGLSSLSGGAL